MQPWPPGAPAVFPGCLGAAAETPESPTSVWTRSQDAPDTWGVQEMRLLVLSACAVPCFLFPVLTDGRRHAPARPTCHSHESPPTSPPLTARRATDPVNHLTLREHGELGNTVVGEPTISQNYTLRKGNRLSHRNHREGQGLQEACFALWACL